MYGATWDGKKASRDRSDGERDMRTKVALDGWTPHLVGNELVEAIRWVEKTAGSILSSSRATLFPEITLSADERSIEDWPSLQEVEVSERRARALSVSRVEQLERIIQWPATYLHAKPEEALVLHAWARCKVKRWAKFDDACEYLGWSRATAYRARDKALDTIARGLAADSIRRGGH